jgi:hypothetical protein
VLSARGPDRPHQHDDLRGGAVRERVATVAATGVATVAAVGWLYLFRNAVALRLGPKIGGALPLQRLAGQDAQPLPVLLLAWAPAGLLVGLVPRRGADIGPIAVAALVGAVSFAVLWVAGAAADALTANEPVGAYVGPALEHGALWVAPAAAALCAAAARRARLARAA